MERRTQPYAQSLTVEERWTDEAVFSHYSRQAVDRGGFFCLKVVVSFFFFRARVAYSWVFRNVKWHFWHFSVAIFK